MPNVGITELLVVLAIALLVIGPERLPGAIRTGSLWLNKFKRGFNDIKREVQQELHNDCHREHDDPRTGKESRECDSQQDDRKGEDEFDE